MELMPSDPQAFGAEMRVSEVSEAGVSVVPVTEVHVAKDCVITPSISFNLPPVV